VRDRASSRRGCPGDDDIGSLKTIGDEEIQGLRCANERHEAPRRREGSGLKWAVGAVMDGNDIILIERSKPSRQGLGNAYG
jgi:hypothetical protein